jgi:broad specificity phosphatase PhoE
VTLPAVNRLSAFTLVALIAFARSAPAQEPLQPTTVILVRHAEKSVPEGDYPLSTEGRDRARELARVLGDAPIAAIYTTQFMRTQQTAQPLAERLRLKVSVIVATNRYVTEVLDRIRTEHAGQTVLVVSHRLAVPALIEALGITSPPTISEEQFDRLFVVTLPPAGAPTLLTLRYGRPAR